MSYLNREKKQKEFPSGTPSLSDFEMCKCRRVPEYLKCWVLKVLFFGVQYIIVHYIGLVGGASVALLKSKPPRGVG